MLTGLAADRIKEGLGYESIPAALKNIPNITGDEWVMESFWELNSCRAVGMAPGPIPWTAIKMFADELELQSTIRDYFFRAIRYLDIIYMEHLAKDQDNGSKNRNSRHQN